MSQASQMRRNEKAVRRIYSWRVYCISLGVVCRWSLEVRPKLWSTLAFFRQRQQNVLISTFSVAPCPQKISVRNLKLKLRHRESGSISWTRRPCKIIRDVTITQSHYRRGRWLTLYSIKFGEFYSRLLLLAFVLSKLAKVTTVDKIMRWVGGGGGDVSVLVERIREQTAWARSWRRWPKRRRLMPSWW